MTEIPAVKSAIQSVIDDFLDAFNLSPIGAGKLIDNKNISPEVKLGRKLLDVAKELRGEFPQAKEMSRLARVAFADVFNHEEEIIRNPDKKLIQWIDEEYAFFRAIEEINYVESRPAAQG